MWNFAIAINTVARLRAYEAFGCKELGALGDVELVRLAIKTRKDQIEWLGWRIKPRGAAGGTTADPRIGELEALWRRPDGATPFATWLRLALEALLVLDAPAIERRWSPGGRANRPGYYPGSAIHPTADETGRRPRRPGEIAFHRLI
jgi:hypothetical protein